MGSSIAEQPRQARAWRELGARIRPHARVLGFGAGLGLLGSAAGLAQPLTAKLVIDALSEQRSLVAPLLALTGLVVSAAVISVAGRYVLERTAEHVVLAARVSLVSRMLRLRVSAMDRLRPGDLLARVTSDTTLLRSVCTHGVVGGVNAVFMLVGSVVLMALLDLALLGVTLAVICLLGAVLALVMSRIGPATEHTQAAIGEVGSVLERALGALRTVKASGAEPTEIAEITTAARGACRHGITVAWWTSLAAVLAPVAIEVSFLVVLGVGGARVATGALAVSSLIAFLLYLFYLIEPIGALVDAATQLQVALAALTRISHVERLPVEPVTGTAGRAPLVRPARPPAAVTFSDVWFRYREQAPLVHSGVTFTAPAGRLTAIVGPSGSGKSTVFALLERFYEPERGTISLDGRDISRRPLSALRGGIGYVEQDAPILAGSLRDNLRYAAPGATDDQIHAALARTQLSDLVDRLPDGLDTTVGHRGSTLSGGERQRVAIARALLRAPRLLLLDEATSQLDAGNELAFRRVIAGLADTTTVLVIAHRLSTVVDARQILVMVAGRLRATGTHEQLVTQDDVYRELAVTRLLAP